MIELRAKLSRLLWGVPSGPRENLVTRWAFLRALGVVYLIAFVSVWVQVDGLYGREGILPVHQYLAGLRKFNPADYYALSPSLLWFGSSDTALHLVCALGTVGAALLAAGVLPAPSAMLCWMLYLSLVNVGQDFLGFQWDELLLETGFLAIFFAPPTLFLTLAREHKPSRVVVWLLRWLCFRLVFSSGVVKLTSGDPVWRDFTAMTFHYATQPLPTWTAWYMHQLPVWFQKFTTFFVLAVELAVPFTIFAPRRVRHLGACMLAGFQVLLLLTGNYCFFNLLSIVLCIPLLDDDALPARWKVAATVVRTSTPAQFPASPVRRRLWWLRPALYGLLAAVLVPLSTLLTLERMYLVDRQELKKKWPGVQDAAETAQHFGCAGQYGLFESMSIKRPEIVIEGSNDGEMWLAYEFKYKPGDLSRRPAFVAPYQPRLDWQMWFAALSYKEAPDWFYAFARRLLEGSAPVLNLLEKNPFPDAPPKYIRAVFYEYQFTGGAENPDFEKGAWWQRHKLWLYLPQVSLEDFAPPEQ